MEQNDLIKLGIHQRQTDLVCNIGEGFEKAKDSGKTYGYPIGTIKVYGGKKYEKIDHDKWVPLKEDKLTGDVIENFIQTYSKAAANKQKLAKLDVKALKSLQEHIESVVKTKKGNKALTEEHKTILDDIQDLIDKKEAITPAKKKEDIYYPPDMPKPIRSFDDLAKWVTTNVDSINNHTFDYETEAGLGRLYNLAPLGIDDAKVVDYDTHYVLFFQRNRGSGADAGWDTIEKFRFTKTVPRKIITAKED